MTLEDFEKSLAEARTASEQGQSTAKKESKHHKHRHHRHHNKRGHDQEKVQDCSKHKRLRRSISPDFEDKKSSRDCVTSKTHQQRDADLEAQVLGKRRELRSTMPSVTNSPAKEDAELKRDSWMQMPSENDIDIIQRGVNMSSKPSIIRHPKADFELKIHDNELNKHHLQDLADGKAVPHEVMEVPALHEVNYVFGDAGSQWRMTKLKAVWRQAEETGRPVEDVALDKFGDLRAFDDAREERVELDRRETYGSGYVGKEKPSGDLFQERKIDEGITMNGRANIEDKRCEERIDTSITDVQSLAAKASTLDQTSLNRLKARMMKAKLRGAADAASLEAEYDAALASSLNSTQPDSVMLSVMENRMLAGGRKGEVKSIDSKRGRERGLVEENEDMSIEDMVKEERRTRYQTGGEGQRFAERIAKDGRFNASRLHIPAYALLIILQNNLDYLDDNAAKLAKRVQMSEINLKNSAISEFQRTNRILDNCPMCHQEESNSPPLAPVVSLATRVYLTLPTEPEISGGGACIVPIQHHGNLLECDDDEWEEIRNFMKSLIRMYDNNGRGVIFYENAAAPQRKKHAALEVVPLPPGLAADAPRFFEEAFSQSDEEWTQHKKVIDTLAKAKQGLGKVAFRRTLVKEMPYFHVWFHPDGGMGHIVEDSNRWPKGDLFARELIGGILGKGPEVTRRQGHWSSGTDGRVDVFRKNWQDFDWTRVFTDD